MMLRRFVCGLALLGLISLPLLAQDVPKVTLEGQVLDTHTDEPLARANVYLANTTIATTTNTEGMFTLENVALGAYELITSHVGYQTTTTLLRLTTVTPEALVIRLTPATGVGPEVEIVDVRPRDWQKNLERFTKMLFGPSKNAKHCRIVNPEVLDFAEERGLFQASASAPLILENRALGYQMTVTLEDFQVRQRSRSLQYKGNTHFEALPPTDAAEADEWEKNRLVAYRGSFRHFVKALITGRLETEGFLLLREGQDRSAAYAGVPGSRPSQRMFPVLPADIVSMGEQRHERRIVFDGVIKVVYEKESAPRDGFFYTGIRPRHALTQDGPQTSWISLSRGNIMVDTNGHQTEFYGVTKIGYWYFERAAEWLPRDYEPPPLAPR